jgi:hypothetical protein
MFRLNCSESELRSCGLGRQYYRLLSDKIITPTRGPGMNFDDEMCYWFRPETTEIWVPVDFLIPACVFQT